MRKIKKHLKVIFLILFVLLIGVAALTTGRLKPEPLPEGLMRVDFIDVGQGDCTLVTSGDIAILIDAGESGSADNVIGFLNENGIEDIDCCIATHPHSDHIGALPQIIDEFKVKTLLMPEIPENIEPTNKTYERFLDSLEYVEKAEYTEIGEIYEFGDIDVEILGPVKDYDDLNNMSLVAKISFGETSLMLTGDAEIPAEEDMLERYTVDYSVDILSVGHHGSNTSTSDEWLDAVDPEFAVISCGLDNSYGHPHKEIIDKLENNDIKYYRTDLLGNITFESDGKKFEYVSNDK